MLMFVNRHICQLPNEHLLIVTIYGVPLKAYLHQTLDSELPIFDL